MALAQREKLESQTSTYFRSYTQKYYLLKGESSKFWICSHVWKLKTTEHKCFGFSNAILQIKFSYYLPINFLCMFTRGYDSYQLFLPLPQTLNDSNLDGLYSTIKCKTNNPANKLFKFSFAGFYFIFTLKSNEPNSFCLSKNVLKGKTR